MNIRACETGRLDCGKDAESLLWNGYALSLFDAWNYYAVTHDEAAADEMCDSLRLVKKKKGVAVYIQRAADRRFDCKYREPKPMPAQEDAQRNLEIPKSTLDPSLTKEQQVEEIRRRIESRRARLRQEVESAKGAKN